MLEAGEDALCRAGYLPLQAATGTRGHEEECSRLMAPSESTSDGFEMPIQPGNSMQPMAYSLGGCYEDNEFTN